MLNKQQMVSEATALPGNPYPITVSEPHFVNQSDLLAPPASGQQEILLGLGCFWGLSACFGNLKGSFQPL